MGESEVKNLDALLVIRLEGPRVDDDLVDLGDLENEWLSFNLHIVLHLTTKTNESLMEQL